MERPRNKSRNKRRSRRASSRYFRPRGAQEFFSRPEKFQDEWNRSLHVISKMRADRVSLAQASREYSIDRRRVLKLAGPALRKKNGRWVATKRDRLLRTLLVPTRDGLREIAVRESQQATFLAQYWDAVQRYLQRGDQSALRQFRGKYITDASNNRISLSTDLQELDRLGNAGVLSFESLYARTA